MSRQPTRTSAPTGADVEALTIVASLAHELRSPLAGVRGLSGTLLGSWDDLADDQRRGLVEAIAADADRLGRLITDILDSARVSTGRLLVHPEPFDLAELVRGHCDRRTGLAKDVELVLDVPDTLVLDTDAGRIEQVLTNLIENALVHGEPPVTIRVEQADSGGAILTVQDSGPGIRHEVHERVFERFWQSDSSPGTGLGLYLVRGIIEALGGTITIEDAPRGATFRIALPAASA